MIIVHFAEYASGGVATYLKDLIIAQSKRKDVEMIYLLASKHNSDEDLLRLSGKKVKVLAYSYHRSFLGIYQLLSLSKTIKRLDPDIIHLHSSFAGLLRMKYIFSDYKHKIVYCSHGWAFNQEIGKGKKQVYRLIEWILSFGCYKIINISKFERRTAWFLNHKKMCVIYNSIAMIEETNVDANSYDERVINLAFVGRLDRQKGIDLLLQAIDSQPEHSNLHLNVVGDSIIDSIGVNANTKRVSFLGWKSKSEVKQIMKDSDILIVPSRWEGFGLVALESMQVGTMVVASDAGALPEIVINNETGMIFKADSVEAIIKVLRTIQKMTKKELGFFGERGKQRYQNRFNYSHMVDSVMNVYYESKYLRKETIN